ncbi:MAG: sulfite exporter TauE/SafE family protein [Candidatus Cloacimonetes bacterium]|nr:sulfite exporter TauE/SafE family protein [Candidatus Cloacimonadota bacterium]
MILTRLLLLMLICLGNLFCEASPKLGLKLSSFKKPQAVSSGPVTYDVSSSHEGISTGTEIWVLVKFKMESGWHIYGDKETIGTPTSLKIVNSSDWELLSLRQSPSVTHKISLGEGNNYTSYFLEDGAMMGMSAKSVTGEGRLVLEAQWQPCTLTSCGILKTEEIVITHTTGSTKTREVSQEFTAFFSEPESVNQEHSPIAKDWWIALIQAFLWGLLASLTPCVYPMIPITVSLFSGETGSSKGIRFFRALIYVLGIVLVYALLGVVAAKTGKDLGSWLANPVVAVFLSSLMLLFALSMFGLFEIDLPQSLKQKLNSVEGTSPGTLFFMGCAMGFVAAPCVGPFAGAIILYLVKHPESLLFGFLMMASFGLGMGVLFLVLALFSQNILPRSGGWMVSLKQGMGFVLLLVAFHFQTVFLSEAQIQFGYSLWFFTGGVLIGGLFRLTPADPFVFRIRQAFGLLMILYGVSGMIELRFPHRLVNASSNAEISAPAKVQEIFDSQKDALKAGKNRGAPVMLYFTAKWCIPCRQIKENILPDPKIQAELARFAVGILDCTEADSEASRVKNQVYQSASMPFFAFYDKNGIHRKDLDQHGKISRDELLKILQSL